MEKGYLAGLVLFYLSSTSALICLSCTHVADVKECLEFKECKPNQKCFSNFALDQHDVAMYTLGCTDQIVCDLTPDNMVGKRLLSFNSVEDPDILKKERRITSNACLQCCSNTDGCNADLCATPKPKHISCMTCSDVTETKLCGTVSECGSDEVCFVHRGTKPGSGRHFYELGCMGWQQCKASQHDSLQDCLACCYHSDSCNIVGCEPYSITTTTQSSLTYHVVIKGLDKGHYNSMVALSCVTTPSAHTFTWKFNGNLKADCSETKLKVNVQLQIMYLVVIGRHLENDYFGNVLETTTLPEGVHFQSVFSQDGVNRLSIAKLNESTFGTYKCTASIEGKMAEEDHFIGIIKERPTVSIIKSTISSNFAMQCKTTGYPVPQIGWTFTSERIGAQTIPPGVQFNDQGFISTLFVNNYHPRDHDGIWYCEAKNNQGNAIANVQIP